MIRTMEDDGHGEVKREQRKERRRQVDLDFWIEERCWQLLLSAGSDSEGPILLSEEHFDAIESEPLAVDSDTSRVAIEDAESLSYLDIVAVDPELSKDRCEATVALRGSL